MILLSFVQLFVILYIILRILLIIVFKSLYLFNATLNNYEGFKVIKEQNF